MTGIELFTIGSTVVTAGQALGAIGAVTGALGALSQGAAAQDAANYNAAVATQQAQREREIANLEAEDFARRQKMIAGASRATRAASGVRPEGTPLLVDDAMMNDALFSEEIIRAGGEARGVALEQEAELSRMRGKSARTASYFSAGSTLLTAASRFGRNEAVV